MLSRRVLTKFSSSNQLLRKFSGSNVTQTTGVARTQEGDIPASHQETIDYGKERIAVLKESLNYVDYKKYPTHISHWDPNSPDYVPCEISDSIEERSVSSYNQIIDDLKTDLRLQEEIYDAIERMDRPYLQGTPGVDRNVYD